MVEILIYCIFYLFLVVAIFYHLDCVVDCVLKVVFYPVFDEVASADSAPV